MPRYQHLPLSLRQSVREGVLLGSKGFLGECSELFGLAVLIVLLIVFIILS
jgi:hypothetical protein